MKVCLDAGHGGKDPGACNGDLHEADAALDMVLKLGAYLNQHGAQVIYTRDTDIYIPLSTRCKIANEAQVDCFVSVHLNAADAKQAHGVETLKYPSSVKSEALAKSIQDKIIAATGQTDRGLKDRPGLYVLKHTDMPAALVETGFISNDEEAKEFLFSDKRQVIVEAIGEGILEWLQQA